ncbi:MAG: hypothetical protein KME04_20005 [Pleurocapsa minor GSE-CHR-MK-17-07R]|jgi:hypothetical protein|nr:hypothetical protein [Pleurocapsa minor GSE-CHR-MK 17-07R]
MATRTMAQKLSLKAGMRVLVLNPVIDIVPIIDPMPEAVTIDNEPDGLYDMVIAFCANKADADALTPAGMEALKEDGGLWMAYPKVTGKAKPDLTRDRGWEAIARANWGPVSQVALTEVWTVMRFKPESVLNRSSNIGGWHGRQIPD